MRLPVSTVMKLHRLLGGHAPTEEAVLTFIRDKYGCCSLAHLSPNIAAAIVDRPHSFLEAVSKHTQPQALLSL